MRHVFMFEFYGFEDRFPARPDPFYEALTALHTHEMFFYRDHDMNEQDMRALTRSLEKHPHVSSVYLPFNGIRPTELQFFAIFLRVNTTLQDISLCSNSLGDRGAMNLASALRQNKTLKVLHLTRAGIQKEGAIALAQSLESNKTLQNLNLSDNPIPEEAGVVFMQMLNINSELKKLCLQGTGISQKTLTEIQGELSKRAP